MTYQQLLDLQAALEAAMLSGASAVDVAIGDRRVKYNTLAEIEAALDKVNRSLCRYNRMARGATQPGVTTPRFSWYG